MKNAYIKFHTDGDYTQVCETLVAHSYLSRLSNNIFCIPWGSLALLDAQDVAYSFASEEELANARPIWNFASAKAR